MSKVITRKLILTCIAIAVLLMFAILLWTLRYRYDKISIRGSSLPIRTNRLTGRTQMYDPFTMNWISSDSSGRPEALPTSELSKVSYETRQFGDTRHILVHNDSSWNITKVGIAVQVRRPGGKVRQNKRHQILIDIKPGTAEEAKIDVNYDSSSEFVQVNIYAAWGTK